MSEPNEAVPEQPAEEAAIAPADDRIAALEADVAKAKDEMLRALAEAENTRRRAERQAADARVYAIDRFANDLLPVADALTRAIEAAGGATGEDALKNLLDGVSLTERALLDAFSRHGLKRVGAKGEAFDTKIHEAVAQIPSEMPAGSVVEVFQPGYVLGDRTVRAAKVVLSLGGQQAAGGESVDIKV